MISLCQPNDKVGCSICCGLLNHQDISKKNLSTFLNDVENRIIHFENLPEDKKFTEIQKFGIRDIASYICPYQTFIADGKPGCSLFDENPEKSKLRNKSLFGQKVCNDFLCPAHHILSEPEKILLIKFVEDWYLYQIAILDPESFQWILKVADEHKIYKGNKSFKKLLNEALLLHSKYLSQKKISLFYYSESEYNLEKENFSLFSQLPALQEEKKQILLLID